VRVLYGAFAKVRKFLLDSKSSANLVSLRCCDSNNCIDRLFYHRLWYCHHSAIISWASRGYNRNLKRELSTFFTDKTPVAFLLVRRIVAMQGCSRRGLDSWTAYKAHWTWYHSPNFVTSLRRATGFYWAITVLLFFDSILNALQETSSYLCTVGGGWLWTTPYPTGSMIAGHMNLKNMKDPITAIKGISVFLSATFSCHLVKQCIYSK